MMGIGTNNDVPGCLLKKHRTGVQGNPHDLCMEVCEGCGWTEEENRRRIYAIDHGGMTMNPYGLETLYVIGNGQKKITYKQTEK